MVIAPGKDGISAFVILADGEHLPENLNSVKTLVFRRGESTGFELQVIKQFGYLADPELVRKPAEAVCNFDKLVMGGFQSVGEPLHQHADGTWWFYEETWGMEHGPYEDEQAGSSALVAYCRGLDAAEAQEPEWVEKPGETTDDGVNVWTNAGEQKDLDKPAEVEEDVSGWENEGGPSGEV